MNDPPDPFDPTRSAAGDDPDPRTFDPDEYLRERGEDPAEYTSPGKPQPFPGGRTCSGCGVLLQYLGRRRFHEGSRWGVLGGLGELFVNQESLDLFTCKNCGKVEFYLPNIKLPDSNPAR